MRSPSRFSRGLRPGSSMSTDDIEVRLARMSERSDAFASDFTNFVAQVNATFTDFRSALESFSGKLEERGRAPWQLLIGFGGLLIVVIGAVSALAYAPIRDTETRLETSVARVADGAVTEKEFITYQQNSTERRAAVEKFQTDRVDRIGNFITDLNKEKLSVERYEEQLKAEGERDASLQRQIDEVRQNVSGIYSPRDALARIERRNDTLEEELQRLNAKIAGLTK